MSTDRVDSTVSMAVAMCDELAEHLVLLAQRGQYTSAQFDQFRSCPQPGPLVRAHRRLLA